MMRKRTTGTSNQDFSQGSVLDALVRMAVPMSLALLINILYSVVDRIYIGHIPEVGRLSLTGIGLISPIVTIIVAFQNLFGVGGSPLFSIARGEGNKEEASRILHNACFTHGTVNVALHRICRDCNQEIFRQCKRSRPRDLTPQVHMPHLAPYFLYQVL